MKDKMKVMTRDVARVVTTDVTKDVTRGVTMDAMDVTRDVRGESRRDAWSEM